MPIVGSKLVVREAGLSSNSNREDNPENRSAYARGPFDLKRPEQSPSSASVRYRSSHKVMIFVIRFLLLVASPRRSGPFLRLGCDHRQGKGLPDAAEAA